MTRTEKSAGATRLATLRVVIPDSVLLRRVESELLVFDSRSNRTFVLDEIGERIWSELGEDRALGAVYEALLARFDVEPHVLERDLMRFVERLAERGLVEIVGVDP